MSQTEIIFMVAAMILVGLIVGNLLFQIIAEKRNAPLGRFIECDGIRLHYIERGKSEAPCVVLFHGNGTMIQDLTISGLVDVLARNSRVICFDRPGFGHSQRTRSRLWTPTAQAELFVKALTHLGVRKPVVFGHSWGTLVATAIALRKDYPVRGLVLASGYYFPIARLDFWMMSGPAIPILGDLFRYTLAPIISWAILPRLFRKLFAPRSVTQSFRNEFPKSLILRPKQLKAAAEESAFLLPVTREMQSEYATIECPVHIIHGKDDQIIEMEQSRRLHKAIGHSVLNLISEGGHMITHEEPHAIARAVLSCLTTSELLDGPGAKRTRTLGP
jgi:pimeloyl-ACP methyl ester carboxylesterase